MMKSVSSPRIWQYAFECVGMCVFRCHRNVSVSPFECGPESVWRMHRKRRAMGSVTRNSLA